MAKSDTIVDTSIDVTIFGRYIAPVLNIKVRFAGQELNDIVTAQYNEAMKRLLPEYDIEFVEIPRYERGEVVSATKVRDAIQNDNREQVKQLVPDTTYHILKKNRVGYKARGN